MMRRRVEKSRFGGAEHANGVACSVFHLHVGRKVLIRNDNGCCLDARNRGPNMQLIFATRGLAGREELGFDKALVEVGS